MGVQVYSYEFLVTSEVHCIMPGPGSDIVQQRLGENRSKHQMIVEKLQCVPNKGLLFLQMVYCVNFDLEYIGSQLSDRKVLLCA